MSRFICRIIWHGSKYWWKTFWGSKTCFKKYSSCKKYFSNDDGIVKLDPVIRIVPGKNLEQQRKFFSTAKRKRNHNVNHKSNHNEICKAHKRRESIIYVTKYVCRGDSREGCTSPQC